MILKLQDEKVCELIALGNYLDVLKTAKIMRIMGSLFTSSILSSVHHHSGIHYPVFPMSNPDFPDA
jgi:hypothetical protein